MFQPSESPVLNTSKETADSRDFKITGTSARFLWNLFKLHIKIYIYELKFNFTNIYHAFHKIMVYYIDFLECSMFDF